MSASAQFSWKAFLNDCKACRFTYGRNSSMNPQLYEAAYNKMKIHQTFKDNSKLQVVDMYSGPGVGAKVFNDMVQPQTHILMEPKAAFAKIAEDHISGSGSIKLYRKEPYLWESFISLTNEDKLIAPEKQSLDHIHDSFLIMGNLTDKRGEQLYMQYLQCVANRNWLQRFGLVKMVLWVGQSTAAKLLAPVGFRGRSRCSLITEAVTKTKLIATSEEKASKLFHSDVLEENDPILIKEEKGDVALLEVTPVKHDLSLDSWDYCAQRLMITKSQPLESILEVLGHGAKEYLVPRLDPRLLSMKPICMTPEDFSIIAREFDTWPFKPTTLIDFYEVVDSH
ncbi:RNA polymerase specificity factor Ecym_6260 [Eremothecium cymbalariae DBVPG|uniref:rRNA adenine N(6)-methyltransferase n=1 Tax=Eremothecium cymbalariae (strain CBS 270.75 / DBVPG 7215 / KCTC 17166 / NRRL Y-17582) TaxID=931890 RepID=G8JVG3_ERECY|nr:hypothetical protein Ecym_6260 [Eremothecium cymbalariae DBVPG\